MRTETYICDLCKQSKSKNDLSKITIKTEGIMIKNQPYSGIQVDVCSDCLRKKGFIVDIKESKTSVENAQATNRKTIEDKLFDILDDLGVAFVE